MNTNEMFQNHSFSYFTVNEVARLRPIKTKDNKRVMVTIAEDLEIYREYHKNICDLNKKKVEEYLMVIRL